MTCGRKWKLEEKRGKACSNSPHSPSQEGPQEPACSPPRVKLRSNRLLWTACHGFHQNASLLLTHLKQNPLDLMFTPTFFWFLVHKLKSICSRNLDYDPQERYLQLFLSSSFEHVVNILLQCRDILWRGCWEAPASSTFYSPKLMSCFQPFRFGCGYQSRLDLEAMRILSTVWSRAFPHKPLYWGWQKIKCRKQGHDIFVQAHEDDALIYVNAADVKHPCCTSGQLICLFWWESGNEWMYLCWSKPPNTSAVWPWTQEVSRFVMCLWMKNDENKPQQ